MRLLDGPFAGKYVYVAEHITVSCSGRADRQRRAADRHAPRGVPVVGDGLGGRTRT